MRHYLCRFRGYFVVVYTTTDCKALHKLIEYVTKTKGNLVYSDSEIKKQAKIKPVDLIDDYGYLNKLSNLSDEIEKLKKEYNNKLDGKLRMVNEVRQQLRELVDDISDDEEDYW